MAPRIFKCDVLATRTSKDDTFLDQSFLPPSFSIETKSWQKTKSWQTNQFLSYSQRILEKFPKENAENSQRFSEELPKNSQKIPPQNYKDILKNSPQKQKIPQKIIENSQKISKNLKISNSLHRT